MDEGWVAGGYIAKLAVKRLRSVTSGSREKIGPFTRQRSEEGMRRLSARLRDLDSSASPEVLLRLRAELVRSGCLE